MEKEIVNVEFSSEAGADLKLIDGKLRVLVKYDGKGVDAGLYADVEPGYFLDKLAAVIPGEIDDQIIALLKAAFLK